MSRILAVKYAGYLLIPAKNCCNNGHCCVTLDTLSSCAKKQMPKAKGTKGGKKIVLTEQQYKWIPQFRFQNSWSADVPEKERKTLKEKAKKLFVILNKTESVS